MKGSRRRARWHDAHIAEHSAFLARAGVRYVALGWKERDGRLTRRMSVKIYIEHKRKHVVDHERLPDATSVLVHTGRGRYHRLTVPTDVVQYGPVRLCAGPSDFLDPVSGGALLSIPGADNGTFGCVVADQNGTPFLLSAAHVAQGTEGHVQANLLVKQPASRPAGVPPNQSLTIGATASGFFGNRNGLFEDFMFIKPNGGRAVVSQALDGVQQNGTVLGWEQVVGSHLVVTKYGAQTMRQTATFSARIPSLPLDGLSALEVYEFKGTGPTPFGLRGDSGALVLSQSASSAGAIVGLLFAVSDSTPQEPGGRGYVVPFERMGSYTAL
jgi:hypothetical protein